VIVALPGATPRMNPELPVPSTVTTEESLDTS